MPQRFIASLLIGVLFTMVYTGTAVSQEAGTVLSATDNGTSAMGTAAEEGANRLQREETPASPTLLDDTAAKMAFLVVLILVGVGYVFIRRQPSSNDFKKKNKRK